jgi:hypothetical protein
MGGRGEDGPGGKETVKTVEKPSSTLLLPYALLKHFLPHSPKLPNTTHTLSLSHSLSLPLSEERTNTLLNQQQRNCERPPRTVSVRLVAEKCNR